MPRRALSAEELEAVAKRAAELVLASDEFRELVRGSVRSPGRRASDAALTRQRSEARARSRRLDAEARQAERAAEEAASDERLVQLWVDGVPRPEIAEALGLGKSAFEAVVARLRREGEERLVYRPGID